MCGRFECVCGCAEACEDEYEELISIRPFERTRLNSHTLPMYFHVINMNAKYQK